jgi:REP element-mobilizing transposase RayT
MAIWVTTRFSRNELQSNNFSARVIEPGTNWDDNKAVSFYRRNLPHFQNDYKPHFVTFVTKGRRILPDWARQIVLDSCFYGHGKKYNLYAAVVMPDHVHLILTPLTDVERKLIVPLQEITKGIKGFSAHAINRQLKSRGTVWQEESFDHVLRSSESLDAKIFYILENPVRRGLVARSWEYRWMWRKPTESQYSRGVSALGG